MIPSRTQDLINRIRTTADDEHSLVQVLRAPDPTKPDPAEILAELINHCETLAIILDRIADELAALSQIH